MSNQKNQSGEEDVGSDKKIEIPLSGQSPNQANKPIPARISEYGGKGDSKNVKEDLASDLAKIDPKYEGFMSTSFYNEQKDILAEDNRISVDFGSMQRRSEENIAATTKYDPSLYSRKADYYNDLMNKSYKDPSMSTVKFMNEVDLRCDDHLVKLKEDVQADRFCCECKVLCCDSCVIEYHHSHIASAKTRIEEYFRKHKLELEDLRSKMNSSIKYKYALGEVNNLIDNHERSLSSYFSKRKAYLETLKAKVDGLLADENDMFTRLKENIHTFYRDECYRRIDKPLKESEDLLIRIQVFLRDWETFSRSDKARALKNDQVSIFRKDSNEISDVMKNALEGFKTKSKVLEKNIEEILKNLSYTDKLYQIETILSDVSSKLKGNFTNIAKLKYDELVVVEENPIPVPSSSNIAAIQNMRGSDDFSLISDKIDEKIVPQVQAANTYTNTVINNPVPIGKNIEDSNSNLPLRPLQRGGSNSEASLGVNQQQVKPKVDAQHGEGLIASANFGYPNLSDYSHTQNIPLPQVANPFFDTLQNNDFLIGIKSKSDELFIYEPKSGVGTTKIVKTCFQDPNKAFVLFPDNCRYVNLGISILITGGYLNKQVSNNCHLVTVSKKENAKKGEDPFEVSILTYSNMIEARERHNIIYLPDRNMVLVCSGFFNIGSEVTDINSGAWKSLGKMNEVRGNATIAYINKRWIYVIGGFKINEKQQGVYHNSAEFLDVSNLNIGWLMIPNLTNNLKVSAMGVIAVTDSTILLCGGYDGSQYRQDIYKVEIGDKQIAKVDKINLKLPGCYIFLHNNFLRIGEMAYNYDLSMNVIGYNPADWSFTVNKS